ncbi:MAG: hypothetical protein LH660_05960 [Phormidesmis sp. CAN_BIN36]|nr:hypothetical protein [Phormidesmis sp. CAN_BIN36]
MFIDRDSSNDSGQPPDGNFARSSPSEESVKMTLTGTRRAVDRMIGLLHRHNIISGSEWSRPVPFRNSNEVISVASRAIQVD